MLDQRGHDVPVATQTRVSFDVTSPAGAIVAPGDLLRKRVH